MNDEISGRAKGGVARAAKLQPGERSEIARKAAAARWSEAEKLPVAAYPGLLKLGEAEIPCAVLDDERRVLTQLGFLTAIGRSRPTGGASQGTASEGLPAFLVSENLKPFISSELRRASEPIVYRSPKGGGRGGNRSFGYAAELLPKVCNVYLEARRKNKLLPQQKHIAEACEILLLALADSGIIGLVDEATGYQEVRGKTALQEILNAYLRKELAAWAKRFPDEFYKQIARLRGWNRPDKGSSRPQIVAHYTKDIVYARLAPGIISELEKRNPVEKGHRKAKHHQWLTEDVGHPALAQHLHAVITLMRVSPNGGWDQFMKMLDVAHPKRSDTMLLPLLQDYAPTVQPTFSNDDLPLFALLSSSGPEKAS